MDENEANVKMKHVQVQPDLTLYLTLTSQCRTHANFGFFRVFQRCMAIENWADCSALWLPLFGSSTDLLSFQWRALPLSYMTTCSSYWSFLSFSQWSLAITYISPWASILKHMREHLFCLCEAFVHLSTHWVLICPHWENCSGISLSFRFSLSRPAAICAVAEKRTLFSCWHAGPPKTIQCCCMWRE